jgi:tRNA threonylcarbamoyladenosine biosynthesis protein TsaE
MPMAITSHNVYDTQRIAFQLGAAAQPGLVLALWGGLGAGKTAFTHGLAQGLGLRDPVSSPTFALIHEYGQGGRLPLYHFDLYRIQDPLELEELGVEDYWYGQGVSVLEWPGCAGEYLPERRVDVTLEAGEGPEERILTLEASDAELAQWLKEALA